MPFPMQRCFQTPDLLFGAFDHLFLRIRSDGQSESHPDSRMQFTPILGAVIPQVFDSMRYGNGIRRQIALQKAARLLLGLANKRGIGGGVARLGGRAGSIKAYAVTGEMS